MVLLVLLILAGVLLGLYFMYGKNALFVLIGAILGIYLTRLFVFNDIEIAGWNLFIETIKNGHMLPDIKDTNITPSEYRDILITIQSTTWYKLVIGAVAGGWIGEFVGDVIFSNEEGGDR